MPEASSQATPGLPAHRHVTMKGCWKLLDYEAICYPAVNS